MNSNINQFECHMYVSARGTIGALLPYETGPRRVVRLEPMAHRNLVDPSFRKLLAAFESVSSSGLSPQTVQV